MGAVAPFGWAVGEDSVRLVRAAMDDEISSAAETIVVASA